jgi:hypothetical protein
MIAGQERLIWPISLYKNMHVIILSYKNTQSKMRFIKIRRDMQIRLESDVLTDRSFSLCNILFMGC